MHHGGRARARARAATRVLHVLRPHQVRGLLLRLSAHDLAHQLVHRSVLVRVVPVDARVAVPVAQLGALVACTLH